MEAKDEDNMYKRLEGGDLEEKKSKTPGRKFKRFDVIAITDGNYYNLIGDHAYFSSLPSNYDQTEQLNPGAADFIVKEWKILQEHLPDTIYVRTYEDRIDLLTAVVIGPTGTPYHKGLFIFDIQISSRYPYVFPKCFFRSMGLRLNPSLNPGRGVCCKQFISGTDTYSIFKILLSIQANLICSEPKIHYGIYQSNYVLPTFWGYWVEKEYLSFNEDIFILNCRTMLAILRKPPKVFEEFVIHHFHGNAESILFTCKLYIDHIPSKVNIEGNNNDEHRIQIATGGELERYKKSMKSMYAKLIKAFVKNGSKYSLENHIKVGDIYLEDIEDDEDDRVGLSKFEWYFYALLVFLDVFLIFIPLAFLILKASGMI